MEYRGFHLQHQHQEEYTTTSVNQSLYKPFTPQAWNSSNTNMYCSSNINSSEFDFERHRTVKDEEISSVNHDSVILSSISTEGELEYYSQSQQNCHTTDHNHVHVEKPILRDEERGILALSNKRYYYNFNAGGASSSLSSCSSLNQYLSTTPSSLLLSSSNSQMLLGESATTATRGLLQLSYDSFALNQPHHHHSISLSYMRQNTPSNTSNNQGSAFISGVARTKTPHRKSCPQPKGFSETNPNKKSRPASCSPLQVRKEKLGDRIQTLQKLVAPFGKTNTASVLTEAIGYIHFLHDQIQTLSVPYMKSSQTRPFTMVQLDSKEEDSRKFNYKPDLRSRGLCLVPISYASYIHNFD